MRYQILLADPPWPVQKLKRATRPNQVSMPYPTMTIPEIKELPVSQVAADKSLLFLWTINKYLRESLDVVESWGFRFQRLLTWDKGNGMCLFGFHHRTEFCLVGAKGKWDIYPRQKAMPTLITEHTHREHSRKPYTIYPYIEKFGSPRLELFARQKREGWTSIGNEIDGKDIKQALADLIARLRRFFTRRLSWQKN